MDDFLDEDDFLEVSVEVTIPQVALIALSFLVIVGVGLFFDWLWTKNVDHVDLKGLGDEEISQMRKVMRVSEEDIKNGEKIYFTRRVRAELRALKAEANVQELSRQNDKLTSEVEHLQEMLNIAEVKAALSANNEKKASRSLSTSEATVQTLRDQFEVQEVRRKMMQEQHHNLLYQMEMRGLGFHDELDRLSFWTSRSEASKEMIRDQNDKNEPNDKYQSRVIVEIGLIKDLKKDIKSCENIIESQSESLNGMHRRVGDQDKTIKQQTETIAAKKDLIQRLIEAAKRDQERLRMVIIEEEYGRIEAERALELERNGWERVGAETESED